VRNYALGAIEGDGQQTSAGFHQHCTLLTNFIVR
jgi:hypothetical protein